MSGWRTIPSDGRRCAEHDQRVTLLIVGPIEIHEACDAPRCWRDAEESHRMIHGAHNYATFRYRVESR